MHDPMEDRAAAKETPAPTPGWTPHIGCRRHAVGRIRARKHEALQANAKRARAGSWHFRGPGVYTFYVLAKFIGLRAHERAPIALTPRALASRRVTGAHGFEHSSARCHHPDAPGIVAL